MALLIGLHGPKHSGKDTAFSFIHQWAEDHGVRAARRGFADAMKLSAAKLFDPSVTMAEAVSFADKLKAPGGTISFSLRVEHGEGESRTYSGEITGRMFLQRYGTEAHRDLFGEDIWVDALLSPDDGDWLANFEELPFPGPPIEIAVITDVRFSNEAQKIKALGGQVWAIERYTSADAHASELALPTELIDRTIANVDGLDYFARAVDAAMATEYGDFFGDCL